MSNNWKNLEEKLKVGTKIKIGPKYGKHTGCYDGGEIIELVEGYFEYDNGLYTETQTAPSIYSSSDEDYESIYHLFGNELEYFMDCEIIEP